MATIHVTDRDGHAHRLQAPAGSILMEVLRDEGMGIEAICGGQCACATCHCLIELPAGSRRPVRRGKMSWISFPASALTTPAVRDSPASLKYPMSSTACRLPWRRRNSGTQWRLVNCRSGTTVQFSHQFAQAYPFQCGGYRKAVIACMNQESAPGIDVPARDVKTPTDGGRQ